MGAKTAARRTAATMMTGAAMKPRITMMQMRAPLTSSHLSPQQTNLKKLLQVFSQSQSVANVVAVYTGASTVYTGASAVYTGQVQSILGQVQSILGQVQSIRGKCSLYGGKCSRSTACN